MSAQCHDACVEKQAHAVCFEAPPLKVRALDQMIVKLETLPFSKQNEKRFSQYARLESLLKR